MKNSAKANKKRLMQPRLLLWTFLLSMLLIGCFAEMASLGASAHPAQPVVDQDQTFNHRDTSSSPKGDGQDGKGLEGDTGSEEKAKHVKRKRLEGDKGSKEKARHIKGKRKVKPVTNVAGSNTASGVSGGGVPGGGVPGGGVPGGGVPGGGVPGGGPGGPGGRAPGLPPTGSDPGNNPLP